MKAIIACDAKGGIGYQNKLPWNKIQGDLPRFKKLTEGQTILMGRNTWDSLPKKPLPNRTNLVVTSTTGVSGATTISDLTQLVADANHWLIGGAKLIESCWDQITEIHLSRVFADYTCDTFIDLLKLTDEFTIIQSEVHSDHVYEIWKRQ